MIQLYGKVKHTKNTDKEEWYYYNSGKSFYYHRTDGPSKIITNSPNELRREIWYYENQVHRFGEPAIIEYRKGQKVKQEYYIFDMLHRLDGPALTHYKNGKIIREDYALKGSIISKEKFLINKQQIKQRRCSGFITEFYYDVCFEKSILHREDGPAVIEIDPKTKQILKEEYYLNGVKLSHDVWIGRVYNLDVFV